MNKAIIPDTPGGSMQDWKALVEAAMTEDDPRLLALRLQEARDALVDEIEGTFYKASSTERQLLLAALNTISGLYEGDARRARYLWTLTQSA
jgi:hypothetical protein